MADSRERGSSVEHRPDRLWRMVAAALAEGGERVAAVRGHRTITHTELAGRSAALAERLRAAGVGPEKPVAVLAADGLDLLVACLAVFRAGGVYLPIDPRWPAGRQAAVLADAKPVAAIGTLPVDVPVLSVDAGISDTDMWPELKPEQAAYLMYTSGSTGRPKGVLVTHGALANRMLWWQHTYPLRQDDVLLATASPGFDISVWELLAGLLSGARLVIAEHQVYGIDPYLRELITAQGITVAHLVPSVLDELLTDERLDSLRLTICGGEVVPPSLRDRLLARSDTLLVHAYGPTETTITVLHDECRPGEVMALGRPMHNTTVSIVDENGQPAGAGELVVGGTPVARGYHGRPAETAARFVPDPGTEGGRLYRTGDRAQWLPDGRIQFLGRMDDQFKVRGHRVDPAEIESLLHEHPAVGRAVVRLANGARVVAYVQGTADPAELRAHLANHLTQAVIPTSWVFLDRFPLTPNGKVDHAALPEAPDPTNNPTGEATTDLERDLCALWTELLGGTVGVADDFFALGGHSLVATRIVAAVWRRHRVRLSMADVLRARTVAALARRVQELDEAPPEPTPKTTNGELPLSHAQTRILFEEEFLGAGLFSVPVLTRWHGPVDEAALRAALNGLTTRHPVLRAAVAQDRLAVEETAEVPFSQETADESRVADIVEKMIAEPFDLTRPPLLRARLIRLDAEHHVFVLVLHHLVIDRWSMRVLADDLRELYAAATQNRDPRLDPPADPAALVPGQGDLDYWVRQLDGVALDADLAVGHPHRTDKGHRAGRAIRLVPHEPITELCATRGVTPFMVLLAAFQVLVHRFSGADDVVVGAPVADRDQPGADAVVSMLVNTVPLRADLRGEPRFTEVLDQCREAVLAAHQHQAVPIERLANALGRRRDRGHHPLMRYLMVWEDTPGPPVELPGVTATPMRPPSYATAFDLTLIARAMPDGVDLELEFNHDVMAAQDAEILADALTALVTDFLTDPRTRIGAAHLTPNTPDPGLTGPTDMPAPGLIRLVRAQATQQPDAPAVVDGAEVTTYAELLRQANTVATRIMTSGGMPGDVVGVRLPRSTALVAALLGVLDAGCAFLPLSPDDPDERVRRQLEISGATLVVDSADWLTGDAVPWPEPRMADAAYVIFTSGSTGEPKGVVVEHQALADHVRWAVEEYGLTKADRVLQFSSVTFDVLLEEVFPTLAAGAAVVLRDEETATSAQALVSQCAAHEVTVLNLPTGYWARLTEAMAEDGLTLPDTTRLMVIGGQQADGAAVERWRRLTDVRLLNAYGPTEVTIGATVAELTPDVSIGTPIPNTRAYLLDRYLTPVPDGTVAELYLAGSGLARGYANRPGLTADRFLPDPFSGNGERMYRTGDLAVRRDDTLYFVGRADRQVKVRGYRIELDEVERAIATHPLVTEAAVVVRGDHLEAHVAGVDADTVRAHVAARLPAFMVPSVIAVVPALPKTATGKVDRAALPPVLDEPDTDFAAPRDDREQAACVLWAEVLDVPKVGVRDSFFALGGHSLLAMDLVRRMRRQGYPELRVPDLFEHPTIEELAPWATGEPQVEDAAAPAVDTAPLSWAQLGIWAQAATTGDGAFHLPVVLRLSGPLNVRALGAAVEALSVRHDLLRCVLTEGEDGPVWRHAAPVPPRVLDEPDLDARLRELVAEPFDLMAAPPVRWTLLRLAEDDHALVVVLHHIAADGWSARVLVRELAELYGRRPIDPAPSFLALAAADRTAPKDETGLAFWADTLAGAPERMDLPTENPVTEPRDPGRHSARLPLPRPAVDALTSLARHARVTVYMTLLAGVQAWLARCCRQTDVVVGTPVADRDGDRTAGIVGPLVNVLPIRADVDLTGSFAEQLAATRAAVLAAFAHRSVPTQRIVQHLNRRGLSHVVFDLDDSATPETVHFGPVTARTLPLTPALGAFDLEVTALPTPDGFDVELRGAADLFSPAGIGHLVASLVQLLAGVAEDPDAPLATIDLLDERERHRLLHAPNQRTLPAQPTDVVSLVAEWVASTPDAPAVTASGRTLTYRELDTLSDNVAAWLHEQGLPAEAPVATRLGRCLELPVLILGIWKAGGVYVPLDPAHPAERHRQILADCQPHVVLDDLPETNGASTSRPLPDQLAYVAYTSGSTGTPKGVQCTQRGLANQLLWSRQAYPLQPGEALAQVAAVGFDISLWEMFHPLASGGRLVVLDQDRHGDVAAVAELVAAERVTVLHLVPTLLEHYLDEGVAESLRHVVCGGEPPSAGLPARFAARTSAALHHTYGPTEASIIATHWLADPELGRLPLGEPLPNARVYLLDQYGQPVPAGVVGELFIGGDVLARGYLGQPGMTAARFVPDPFADTPGARMYRTGDLARHRADGGCEFVGRADRQVKIAGVRVEPHEVEAAITADERVAACVVVPREDATGVVSLVGYVVPTEPAPDLCAELRKALRERLPRAMVPAHLIALAELPVGVNGKLDVTALPDPEGVPVAPVEAGTDTEQSLAAIWSQVLPAGHAIGPRDNFFDLGGDSVSAIRVVARARAAGLKVELGQVLRTPTLGDLAATTVPLNQVAPRPASDGQLWLTPAQRRFLAAAGRKPGHFNQAVLTEPTERIDPAILKTALNAVAAHHDAFRLRAVWDGEGWANHVILAPPTDCLVVMAEELTAAQARPVHEAMDIEHGPLLGALVGEQFVLLVAHHFAVDAASWETVLSDLDTAYRQLSQGEPVNLPVPATSFADFARALPAPAAPELGDLPRLPSDADGDDSPVLVTRPAEALLAAASRHRLRVDELLLASLVQVIARWTGDHKVAVLRETHGRSGPPDLTGTVGWLTDLQPLLVDVPADPLATLFATRAALATPSGPPGTEPELVVNYLGVTGGDPGPGLFARAEQQYVGDDVAPEHATPHGIEVIAGIDGRGLWMEWLYDPARFSGVTMRRLAEELCAELDTLVSTVDELLAAHPNATAILPLSPAQQGMLAWHLAHPKSTAYHTQILFALDGDVDEATLRDAWQDVVTHTDVFRAVFPSAGLDEPVQVIGAPPPLDWRRHTSEDEALAADRAEPFDPAEPGQQRWHWIDGRALLWSHHHILLDGWSLPLVLADVGDAYAARIAGQQWTPPHRPGYDAYLTWLSTVDEQAGERFWRTTLAGATPTRLGRAGTGGAPAMVTADLPPDTTAALVRLAERSRATLHSVVLAVWSLLLGQRGASQDVIFGVVMSLRPDEIPGAEQLIGLCLNTVPLRVRLDEDADLATMFGQVQERLVDVYQHAAHPPGRIRRWAGTPDALFDSIVVFENYPGDRGGQALGEHGRLRTLRAVEHTEFAVSLTVMPEERLTFELTYAGHALTSAEAAGLVRRLTRLLERIASESTGRENP